MLRVSQLTGFNVGGVAGLKGLLDSLGLGTGLVVLLDAGDAASYTSGQTWFDLSGLGNNYYVGSASGVDANDCSFNGTPGTGGETNYFYSTGSDEYFNPVTTTTFDDGFFKTGGTFTLAVVGYWTNGGGLGGNDATGIANGGGEIWLTSGGLLHIGMKTGSGTGTANSTVVLPFDAMGFSALSFTRATNTAIFQANASQNVNSAVGGSGVGDPSNPPGNWQVMGADAGGFDMFTGCRVHAYFLWNVALTTTQLSSLYSALKGRFTSLP